MSRKLTKNESRKEELIAKVIEAAQNVERIKAKKGIKVRTRFSLKIDEGV